MLFSIGCWRNMREPSSECPGWGVETIDHFTSPKTNFWTFWFLNTVRKLKVETFLTKGGFEQVSHEKMFGLRDLIGILGAGVLHQNNKPFFLWTALADIRRGVRCYEWWYSWICSGKPLVLASSMCTLPKTRGTVYLCHPRLMFAIRKNKDKKYTLHKVWHVEGVKKLLFDLPVALLNLLALQLKVTEWCRLMSCTSERK